MTTPVLLVPHGDAIYAVPVEEAKKYALEGQSLVHALAFLAEGDDVTGQSRDDPYKKIECHIPTGCGKTM